MYKIWIEFTVASTTFFIVCLSVVNFYNERVFRNLWEKALLLTNIINLILASNYYRVQTDALAVKINKWDRK